MQKYVVSLRNQRLANSEGSFALCLTPLKYTCIQAKLVLWSQVGPLKSNFAPKDQPCLNTRVSPLIPVAIPSSLSPQIIFLNDDSKFYIR